VLIHAAGVSDQRDEAWDRVPASLRGEAEDHLGGIIGCVDLIGVRRYETAEQFREEVKLHLNDPTWFLPPLLFGFEMRDARRLPFQPCKGQVRFFRIQGRLR
jgi:hypothetical protein